MSSNSNKNNEKAASKTTTTKTSHTQAQSLPLLSRPIPQDFRLSCVFASLGLFGGYSPTGGFSQENFRQRSKSQRSLKRNGVALQQCQESVAQELDKEDGSCPTLYLSYMRERYFWPSGRLKWQATSMNNYAKKGSEKDQWRNINWHDEFSPGQRPNGVADLELRSPVLSVLSFVVFPT